MGDIDGDDRPEIVVCSDRVYAVRSDGSAVPGFPVDLGAYIWASPVLVDVDGDGRPEIVVGDFLGRLWALRADGATVRGFPRRMGSRITAAPRAADLDGDGYLELLVATADGRVAALPTESYDDPISAPWPGFPAHATDTPLLTRPDIGGGGQPPGPVPTVPPGDALAPRSDDASADGFGDLTVRTVPGVPRPFRPTEVSLEASPALRERLDGGLLWYVVDGRRHPSPVLSGGGRSFALVQPLPPLRRVDLFFELRWDGCVTRFPREGVYRVRIGVHGPRLRT